MRGYGMDYDRDRSGWMGGRDRGYDAGYGQGWGSRDRGDRWTGGRMNQGGAFRGRGGEYGSHSRRDFLTNQGDFSDDFGGGHDYGYEGTNRGGFRGWPSRDYGHDYSGMDRGGMDRGGVEHGGDRFFRHWTDEDDDGWESHRHGMPRNVGRGGMSYGGNERWLDDNGFPRGYQGRGIHNFSGTGRDHFKAYGANFRNRYDPQW